MLFISRYNQHRYKTLPTSFWEFFIAAPFFCISISLVRSWCCYSDLLRFLKKAPASVSGFVCMFHCFCEARCRLTDTKS